MKRRGFICAGCWTVDRIKLTDVWPSEEGLGRIQDVDRHGGGSAHNTGIDLRRLDAQMPVRTVGVLGKDEDGDFLFAQAQAHGIETTHLYRSDERPTSYTDVISIVDTGKRTFFHYTGTNDLLTPEHFDFSNTTEKILHLGLLGLHKGMDATRPANSNGWSKVLESARQHGIATSIEMVSVQPERNRELTYPCLPWLDYLIVNDAEIGALADMSTVNHGQTDVDACMEAAKHVLEMGAMSHVAVHYPMGALCLTRNQSAVITSSYDLPQSEIAGAVGAGDAFASGLLYGLHENWTLDKALDLGHVAAAASLRSPNTVESVQSIDACRNFAHRFKKRSS